MEKIRPEKKSSPTKENYVITDASRERFLKKFGQLKQLEHAYLDNEIKRKRVKELQNEIRELDLKIEILNKDVSDKNNDTEGTMILEGLRSQLASKTEELDQLRLLIKQEEQN